MHTNKHNYIPNILLAQISNWLMQFHRIPTNVQKHQNYIYFMDIHVYNTQFLLANVIQTNLSKSDKRLFLDVYLCRLHLKHGKENLHDFIFWSFWHKHFFIFFVIVGRTRQATKDTLQCALSVSYTHLTLPTRSLV